MNKNVLIIDIELTCWNEKTDKIPEIIEVGIVEVDIETQEIKRTRQLFVKPEETEISDFCTELTGITTRKVMKQGFSYNKMVDIMISKFGSKNKLVVGWGRDDKAFRSENTPISDYMNFSALYSIMNKTKENIGLSEALKREGMSFEGNPHSGLDDAINTAKLFIKLFKES